jgi:hypothetical protein
MALDLAADGRRGATEAPSDVSKRFAAGERPRDGFALIRSQDLR